MFSIDVNTFKGERFAVPPLKPLGLNPGNPQPVSGVSVKSPTTLLDDAESTGSEAGSSDDGLSDIWTTKPDQSVARNLVRILALSSCEFENDRVVRHSHGMRL